MNALAQGALLWFTQWSWVEHPTFRLGGGNSHRPNSDIATNKKITLRELLIKVTKLRQIAH